MKFAKNGNPIYESGDRVILTYKGFSEGPSNPVWGGKYSCAGTIANAGSAGIISVLWDNGKKNTYRNGHLKPLGHEGDNPNPNFSFILYKIKGGS